MTAEELRAAGWDERKIAAYERAGQELQRAHELPPPRPPQLPQFTAAPPLVLARGDRGTWSRTTVAGMLKAAVDPDGPEDDARELVEARTMIDAHEFTYGRRPSMAEARLAVGRRSDGVVLSGTAEEIGRAFRQAGLPFGILNAVEPLPPPGDAVVTRSR